MRSRKLGRTSAHRSALYRNMVTSLLDHERIETTDAKAKEVRRLAEKMITLGKRGTLHARRRALRVIRKREVTAKVFDDLAERYRDRPGGYTRVLKLRTRPGDAAPISIVELVESEGAAVEASPVKKADAPKKARKQAEEKPEKKTASAKSKKTTAKKASTKKTPAKKSPAKKASSKKAASKKTASKKASSKKTASKKTAGKKTTRKKSD
jgi:large subunit ribosomal protein L17